MNIAKIKFFLQAIAILHIIGGLGLPFLIGTPLFNFYTNHLYAALGVIDTLSRTQVNFMVAMLGPTIASWGILFLYIVNSSFDNPNSKAWWTIIIACLIWAPMDSYLSIKAGVSFNAALNLLAFVSIIVPMFIVKSHFFHAASYDETRKGGAQ